MHNYALRTLHFFLPKVFSECARSICTHNLNHITHAYAMLVKSSKETTFTPYKTYYANKLFEKRNICSES